MSPSNLPPKDAQQRERFAVELQATARARQRARRAAERRDSSPWGVLASGWGGTVLAGSCFTIVLMLVAVTEELANGFPGWSDPRAIIGMIIAVTLCGVPWAFFVGFLLAGVVGGAVHGALGLAAQFCGLLYRPVQVSAWAGGITGMLCVVTLQYLAMHFESRSTLLLLVALAVAMGQLGAWSMARRRYRLMRYKTLDEERQPPPQLRLGLRQLFSITTVVCIVAALLAVSRISPGVYGLFAFGLAFQLILSLLVAQLERLRRTRDPAPMAVESGLHSRMPDEGAR